MSPAIHKRLSDILMEQELLDPGRLAEAVAEQLALAADNLRLLDETQRRAARERLVGEITDRMRETLDVDTVLQTAVREMRRILDLAEAEVRLGTGPVPGKTGDGAERGQA